MLSFNQNINEKEEKEPIVTNSETFQVLQWSEVAIKLTDWFIQKVGDRVEDFTIELETMRKNHMGI